MARMPGTIWQGEQSPGTPMSRYDIVSVHTIVGYAPAHAAHFSVKADGTIIQSRDTKYRSAANLNGNHRVIAIENEDHGAAFGGTPRLPGWVPLTPAQVASNARILAWAHETHGVPLQLCPNSRPASRGLAYHRQGIDGNFGGYKYPGRVSGGEVWTEHFGKVCPTDVRIAQLPAILSAARGKAPSKPPTTLPGKPVMDPLARPLWRGRTNVDAITAAAIEYAETFRTNGGTFDIIQGSYQSSVEESAGTHDRGGAIDARCPGGAGCQVLALRKGGFAAWHRTPAQGPWIHHDHAILVDHPYLSESASDQVDDYRARRNGLKNNGADDGPRLNPIPTFTWKQDEIMAEQADRIINALGGVEDRIVERVAGMEARTRKRDYAQQAVVLKAIEDDAKPGDAETIESLRERLAAVQKRLAAARKRLAEQAEAPPSEVEPETGEGAGTPGEALAGE